jgi:hypothetical protein
MLLEHRNNSKHVDIVSQGIILNLIHQAFTNPAANTSYIVWLDLTRDGNYIFLYSKLYISVADACPSYF